MGEAIGVGGIGVNVGGRGRDVELGAGIIVNAEVADDKSGPVAAGRAIRMYTRLAHKSTKAITSIAISVLQIDTDQCCPLQPG